MVTQRVLTLIAALAVGLVWSIEPLVAQRGPPPLPPGLHDRALPPGKPFDGGGIDPPGQQLAARAAADEGVVTALRTLLPDESFDEGLLLTEAVAAFNRAIERSDAEALLAPSPILLEARERIARGLHKARLIDAVVQHSAPDRGETAPSGRELRDHYRFDPAMIGQSLRTPWMAPGISATIPSATGLGFGEVFAGVSYQPRARMSDGHTGAAAAGFGLGNPESLVGVQIGINSFSTVSSGFLNRGGVDVHVHRVLPHHFMVAMGWESAIEWGGAERDSGSSLYGVVSRGFDFRPNHASYLGETMLSLGVGTSRFQSESAFYAYENGVGVFGSAAVRLSAPLSVMAEWTGQDLFLGASMTPFQNQRMAITAGLVDVTGAAGDGARFAIGTSFVGDFRSR